jgi:hypothetical protein
MTLAQFSQYIIAFYYLCEAAQTDIAKRSLLGCHGSTQYIYRQFNFAILAAFCVEVVLRTSLFVLFFHRTENDGSWFWALLVRLQMDLSYTER